VPTRSDLALPRKLTIRANDRKLVLVKRAGESERHVLLKALVFGLYAGTYPRLAVEVGIGKRYKPDLVALDDEGRPVFWAECGEIGRAKIVHLVRAYPHTHLVIAKQTGSLAPYLAIARSVITPGQRTAPTEFLNFPPDAHRFLRPGGAIEVSFEDCERVVL
jgi:hypothetical protein